MGGLNHRVAREGDSGANGDGGGERRGGRRGTRRGTGEGLESNPPTCLRVRQWRSKSLNVTNVFPSTSSTKSPKGKGRRKPCTTLNTHAMHSEMAPLHTGARGRTKERERDRGRASSVDWLDVGALDGRLVGHRYLPGFSTWAAWEPASTRYT